MKCGEPKPGGSYQDCDKELRHGGDHSYLGQRWPRLQLAEPDDAVLQLLEDTVPPGSWGVMERRFPVVVTTTSVHVVWVDAETEDEALAYWGGDPTDLSLDGTEVLDGSIEIERPDNWQRQAAFTANRIERQIGPLVPCPGCGAEAFRREWSHNPLRRCHGPIEWRETSNSNPKWRWRREYRRAPAYSASSQAVTA